MIILLSISPFMSVNIRFIYLNVAVLDAYMFSTVQSLSCVRLFVTSWTAAHQASLSITNFWSLLKLMSIESIDAIQPSHLLPSPSPPDFNLSQHQDLFK